LVPPTSRIAAERMPSMATALPTGLSVSAVLSNTWRKLALLFIGSD